MLFTQNRALKAFSGCLASIMVAIITVALFLTPQAYAASAAEIDASVNTVLSKFAKDVKGGREFLNSAKGVLVIPKVFKAGFGIGGEYGEGALRIKGRTVDYYSLASASFGFQLGAQQKTVILVFMQQDALSRFQASSGWKVGVDGSVALVAIGAGGAIDTNTAQNPIVGFVFNQKGLMYNLSLEGSKFTKLKR